MIRSARWRLTVLYVGVLALILGILGVLTYTIFSITSYSFLDNSLSEVGTSFEVIATRHFEDKSENMTADQAVSHAAEDVSFKNYKVFVFEQSKQFRWQTRTLALEPNISTETARSWLDGFSKEIESNVDGFSIEGESYRVHYHPFSLGGIKYSLLVVHPLKEYEAFLGQIRNALLLIVPIAIFLASVGGYLVARRTFAPIAKMSETATHITAANLNEKLPVANEEDELGRLAKAFNDLLGRLDSAFELQKRFMADAAHELRTPVSIVRGEAEVSLTNRNREASEYLETIEIMQREAERMSRIIEDLFTIAKVDSGKQPVNKTPIYLDDVLAETLRAFKSLAAGRNISVTSEIEEDMKIIADEFLLRRLFTNLVDNAIKHARSRVKVKAGFPDGQYVVDVVDDGEGIPVEQQTRVFERFYRADKSRSKKSGSLLGSGAGLGLSIGKWIAQQHSGELTLSESTPRGSRFTVKLPSPHTKGSS
ncbi:MAG: HAMP domain-containing protein [Aridibacter famidurans]|nr:HAMP domain-containing protein [Aridibacter famidurans]